MHKTLKVRLWGVIESELRRRLDVVAKKRTSNWRLFEKKSSPVFVTAEYSDVAGGRFFFYFGRTAGSFPTQKDVPSGALGAPMPGGFVLVRADAMGIPHALVEVELSWQTPSKDLVQKALKVEDAASVLALLGVTTDTKHDLLSYGVIESLGIEIPNAEFDMVVERFRAALDHVLSTSIVPTFQEMSARP